MASFKEENSYSNILKRLSAFGGVQIFNIFVGLLRGKFVAMFLGPVGMGISSLYASSLAPLQQVCGLGLNLAMVKEISANKDNPSALRRVLAIISKLILFTSLLGVLACGLGAPLWSKITFGNNDHTFAYIWLSIFTGLSIGGAGLLAILQGLGEVKRLSKATLVGGLSGLFFGVPLYYLFGDGGIVPAMIILAFSSFLFYFISYRNSIRGLRLRSESEITSDINSSKLVKSLISMGLILLVGALSGQVISYLINLYIRSMGSIEDVGLFQGANSITNQYTGIIMSSLALDYFPRLSACCQDNVKMKEVVNRQTEIVMLVATPLIILLLLTAPLVIRILLTDSFLQITPLMRWMGMGMLIQILAFPLGYIYVAKDDRKAYIWMECVWANICWLVCSIGFYHLFGLLGLGVSLVVRGVVDLIINFIVCHRRYGFSYSRECAPAVIISLIFSIVAFGFSIPEGVVSYVGMSLLLIISSLYSYRLLRSKLRKKE